MDEWMAKLHYHMDERLTKMGHDRKEPWEAVDQRLERIEEDVKQLERLFDSI